MNCNNSRELEFRLLPRWDLGDTLGALCFACLVALGVIGIANANSPFAFWISLVLASFGGIGLGVQVVNLIRRDGKCVLAFHDALMKREAAHNASLDAIIDAIETLGNKDRVGRSKTARALKDRLVALVLKQLPVRNLRRVYCEGLQKADQPASTASAPAP